LGPLSGFGDPILGFWTHFGVPGTHFGLILGSWDPILDPFWAFGDVSTSWGPSGRATSPASRCQVAVVGLVAHDLPGQNDRFWVPDTWPGTQNQPKMGSWTWSGDPKSVQNGFLGPQNQSKMGSWDPKISPKWVPGPGLGTLNPPKTGSWTPDPRPKTTQIWLPEPSKQVPTSSDNGCLIHMTPCHFEGATKILGYRHAVASQNRLFVKNPNRQAP
jgi:hypothetical protein